MTADASSRNLIQPTVAIRIKERFAAKEAILHIVRFQTAISVKAQNESFTRTFTFRPLDCQRRN